LVSSLRRFGIRLFFSPSLLRFHARAVSSFSRSGDIYTYVYIGDNIKNDSTPQRQKQDAGQQKCGGGREAEAEAGSFSFLFWCFVVIFFFFF
jgi:hypothetical protein